MAFSTLFSAAIMLQHKQEREEAERRKKQNERTSKDSSSESSGDSYHGSRSKNKSYSHRGMSGKG